MTFWHGRVYIAPLTIKASNIICLCAYIMYKSGYKREKKIEIPITYRSGHIDQCWTEPMLTDLSILNIDMKTV